MAKRESRLYRLNLGEFERYLGNKVDELTDCHKQTQRVQKRLQTIFDRELAAWQEVFGYCYPRLLKGRRDVPPALVSHVDAVELEELARIRGEIADLAQRATASRQEMDRLMQEGQQATGALRDSNPDINEREEKLKRLMVKYQDQYADAYEEVEALDAAPMGWITNAGKIRQAKKRQKEAKRLQDNALERLRHVRNEWLTTVEQAADTQSELRKRWQTHSIRASEAQGQREHREANLETLAEQAAIRRVLEELDVDYQVEGELGKKLVDLAQRNRVRLAYQKGLGASAEALGLMGGIGKGLKKFHKSVASVRREQQKHSLPKIAIMVPHSAALFNETWRQFATKIDDPKYMAEHPLEFADLVDRYFTKRMYDETIKAFFENLGDALNQATKRWD